MSDLQLTIDTQLKIQVAMNGLPWADLEDAGELGSYSDACQWLAAHDGEKLQRDGVSFRIMPKDYPCAFVATLESHPFAENDCS